MNSSNRSDLLCGRSADYLARKEYFPMFVCSIITVGGILRIFLRNSEVIVLTILSLAGFVIGQLAYHLVEVHQVVYPLLKTPSFSLLCYFLPIIIFMAALEVDLYILKNIIWQVLLTTLISFVTSFILIGYVVMNFNPEAWDPQSCLLFSIVLAITDPFYSVNALKIVGGSKMYSDIIRGESLIVCGVTAIFFGMFRSRPMHVTLFSEIHVLMEILKDICGSTLCGYLCSRLIPSMLSELHSKMRSNVILCVSMVYLIFYLVEFCGMSGIVALIALGLNLDSLSFKPRMEFLLTKFLTMLSSVYQNLIYTFFGIVIGCGEIKYFSFYTVVFVVILFTSVNFVRMLTIVLVSPILMRWSYEYNWRWGFVIAWSGIKGIFSILMAPDIHRFAGQRVLAPHMFIFYAQVISLLTMGINSYLMSESARLLGLCNITLPRQMAIQNVIQHIQKIIQNTITLFKTEKNLANVNWDFVEDKTRIRYMTWPGTKQFCVSPREVETSPTDAVLIEEARLHVAMIQTSSFEKQCNDGILRKAAARILIGAVKSYCPSRGKFLSIYDVSTYVRARSWLMKFKNVLTYLGYHKERIPFPPPGSHKLMMFVYHIVFSEEFEYVGHIVTLIYVYPLIIHLWPMARELNVSTLITLNYYFMFVCILQSSLKIIIMKRRYFEQHWNILEFLIVIIGIIDVFCIYFVRLRPDNLLLIQVTVMLGYLRVIRFLHIFKILIPVLRKVVEVMVKKRLCMMFHITKGYIKSQEDTKLLLRQISACDSVYQKLQDILETNKRDAVRELGLMEHEDRDVVIAVKTEQAIRNVIAKALKNLNFLWSRGIIDKHEGSEVNEVLLTKIKALNNFPMAIPPPTADKYLPNIVWLENKYVLIDFFKERTRLAFFDYGDVICREGDRAQGIYLIVSGMASLRSSSPTFGIDSILKPRGDSKAPFTEYCTSGDVLGELSCLVKREIQYTAICETVLQAFFISVEDLYEGLDAFWPSLEYKIWLKLALSIACQYFKASLEDENLKFQSCVMDNHAYVETLSRYVELPINNATMKFVIVVYGNVINTKTEEPYFAPCIIPKTCDQVQGASDLSKLLIIQASDPDKDDNTNLGASVDTGLRMTRERK
ncbi:sodium/hydrogen exchanger 11 isoform X2 [Ochotona princeps]|uniref:sodium/hydrogen exchanger 11 isoform X2 n=1 Tax=Ochotona princeps TaxID=9978 RepID=UPI0027146667|nr:sodium/hydrogen exchanger 11 isoform X2 [Ochotona princeps]